MHATQAASQPVSLSLCLSYDDIFKIQRVRNAFTLNPVSFSALASYLECPWCMLAQRRKKRPKEPPQFTPVRQPTLFSKGSAPDARAVGTLLHVLVNYLHDPAGPLTTEQRETLLTDSRALLHFMRHDLLSTLQNTGKINLATFLYELSFDPKTLYTTLITPMLHYQHEFVSTGSVVFAAAERFQFKLLSTKSTFAGHPDRGGHVGLVGEFDQIRLHRNASQPDGIPSIIEFKKGLGGNNLPPSSIFSPTQPPETDNFDTSADTVLPSVSHAMQLMIYWMAFQTRWDILENVKDAKGMLEDIRMPLHQQLELIIYNLNDGCRYQLVPTNQREALSALTECIFYLDWAMKSGYAWRAPEHGCKKIPLTEVPPHAIQIQVGYTTLPAQECYLLAREAWDRFKDTVRWQKLSHARENHTFQEEEKGLRGEASERALDRSIPKQARR